MCHLRVRIVSQQQRDSLCLDGGNACSNFYNLNRRRYHQLFPCDLVYCIVSNPVELRTRGKIVRLFLDSGGSAAPSSILPFFHVVITQSTELRLRVG